MRERCAFGGKWYIRGGEQCTFHREELVHVTTALSGVAPEQLPEEMYVVVPERHAADGRGI